MATTTINRELSPQVRKAIETLPNAELESIIRQSHPEFFQVSHQEEKNNKLAFFKKMRKELLPSSEGISFDDALKQVRNRSILQRALYNMPIYVLDTSVLGRLYAQSEDYSLVETIIEDALEKNIELICPDLLWYEFASALYTMKLGETSVKNAVGKLKLEIDNEVYRIVPFSFNRYLKAVDMAGFDTKSHGYVSVFDAYFHCLALELGGTFITADKKHHKLTKEHFGSVKTIWDFQGKQSNS